MCILSGELALLLKFLEEDIEGVLMIKLILLVLLLLHLNFYIICRFDLVTTVLPPPGVNIYAGGFLCFIK